MTRTDTTTDLTATADALAAAAKSSWRLRLAIVTVPALLSVLLAGCSKPVDKAEDIRPVRVQTLATAQINVLAEFPGDVRARVESKLGFRVGGKVVTRKINLGDVVKSGQILLQLDPQDLRLAQAQANLANAEATARSLNITVPITSVNTVSQLQFTASGIEDARAAVTALSASAQS